MSDDWDDEPTTPAKKPGYNNGYAQKKAADDDWAAAPSKPKAAQNDDGWDDTPTTTTSYNNSARKNDGWNTKKNDDSWGNDWADTSNDWGSTSHGNNRANNNKRYGERSFNNEPPKKKPFSGYGNDSRGGNSDRPRVFKPNWICTSCNAEVFASKDECFKCHEPKSADAKEAPPREGGARKRPNDWICDGCGAKVFGSKDTCFKCSEPKGNSKDAPADGDSGGRSGGGFQRKSDWICDGCGAKVFGSKDTCFKCSAPKGDSKDAPNDGESSNRRGGDGEDGAKADGPPRENYVPVDIDENELFTTGISTGINFKKYNDIPVKVTGDNVPKPCNGLDDCGLNKFLLGNVKKANYTTLTPIQKYSIPIVLGGRDMMACAQTGSGKTAAFLLPMLEVLMKEQADLSIGSPQVVIVSPTRELVTQIYNEARKFAQGSIIKVCQAYGGTSSRFQSGNIASGCHILVATPGRLLDFCEKTYVQFDKLKFFVLDEADRMLDMGFKPAVEQIMRNPTMVPKEKRQTLMFSATFPKEIQHLAGEYLRNYLFVTVGIVGGACSDVNQKIMEVTKFEKRNKLMELLNAEDPVGTMVFVETKKTADFLASFLSESEHPTTSIHGDRKQSQREEALRDFKAGRMKVIIATAVAARGLDIPKVRHVINYDLPKTIDEYVHRIGRTGRVGNVGKSTSLYVADQDAEIINDLIQVLKDAKQEVPDFLGTGGSGGGNYSSGNGFGGSDFRKQQQTTPASHGAAADDEEW